VYLLFTYLGAIWLDFRVHMLVLFDYTSICIGLVYWFRNTRIYLVLLFSISFDQNGFHVNPCPLVGHFYVIFENHVSPPVYLQIVIKGVFE
jgi:hypothetical protein